jgi:hypothetical protein
MRALFVLVVGLGVPGCLPALAMAWRSPVVVFLSPLVGAGMAAVAAVIELGAGGSLVADYAVVAVIVNLAVVGWLAAGRPVRPWARPPWAGQPWGWPIATVVIVLGCVAIPLTTLRIPQLTGDANAIWLTHALMVYGGHHELVTGLRNAAYRFTNPDYPPLIPAAGALAFAFFGLSDLHHAIEITVLLNACALGVLGTGIAAVGSGGRRPARIAATVAAGAICLVGFGVSGIWGTDGYADLLWAAAAAAAVVWGLVLPPSARALAVAWTCAVVASLTKNEGLTSTLVLLVLIALRYRPLTMPGPAARNWARRAVFAAVPALPGLAWAGIIRLLGIHDAFFKKASGESLVTRAGATTIGMAAHLTVAPVALAVLLAGGWLLRGERERVRLGNPAWLWASCLGSLAIIFGTYLVGGLEIHGWLASSVNRTTIFAQVLLYSELAIWLVIAADGAFARETKRVPETISDPGAADTSGAEDDYTYRRPPVRR